MAARMRFGLLVVLVLGTAAASARSQERTSEAPKLLPKQLTVELASGRKFTGHVDARTNDQHLVLRFTSETTSITRPIEWSRVVKALVDGEVIEAGKLREVAEGMKSESSRFKVQGSGDRGQGTGARSQEEATAPPRAVSVTFDARLANWDADVETDGILVELYPLSADGHLAAVDGTVEIELFAPQLRAFDLAPRSGGQTLERVERWTQVVRAGGFGASGTRLKLPFGAVHPEFDLDWLSVGLVHVRLVVPGDGVFEDSQDGLRIRPYAPLRDRLEMHTGHRFLPTEGLGRRD